MLLHDPASCIFAGTQNSGRYLCHEDSTFGKFDLLRPEMHRHLIEDVKLQTGLDIKDVSIKDMDYLNRMATLVVIYYVR